MNRCTKCDARDMEDVLMCSREDCPFYEISLDAKQKPSTDKISDGLRTEGGSEDK